VYQFVKIHFENILEDTFGNIPQKGMKKGKRRRKAPLSRSAAGRGPA
jgi:hypothetical protein